MNIGELIKDPFKASQILEKAIIEKNKELAEILIPIVKSSYLTTLYAKKIARSKIKDEWEDIIMQNPYNTFEYARTVLKKPFPRGEDVIANDPLVSFYYAKEVLKGPFLKGEDAIAKFPSLSLYYAKDVLHDRFPKGEKAIIEDAINRDQSEEKKSYFGSYVKFLKSIGKLDEFLNDHPEVEKWIS
jgi:lambda repressor-like predicted transcriptional regulator